MFSLTWPVSMEIYWNKESVYIRKEFNSQRTGLGHQHGHCFIVLGHQYGHRDIMRKHSIINIFVSYQLWYLWFCKINVCMLAAKKNSLFSIDRNGLILVKYWQNWNQWMVMVSIKILLFSNNIFFYLSVWPTAFRGTRVLRT